MFVNPLIDHPVLAPLTLVALIVFGPVVGFFVAGRRRLAGRLAAAACLPVIVLTLVPVDRELFGRCAFEWALPTFGRVELLANVILFIPPVLLAGVATRRPLAVAAVGTLVSATIEGVQAAVPALGRSCDTTDWLSNSIGAAVGATLAMVSLAIAARIPKHDRDQLAGTSTGVDRLDELRSEWD